MVDCVFSFFLCCFFFLSMHFGSWPERSQVIIVAVRPKEKSDWSRCNFFRNSSARATFWPSEIFHFAHLQRKFEKKRLHGTYLIVLQVFSKCFRRIPYEVNSRKRNRLLRPVKPYPFENAFDYKINDSYIAFQGATTQLKS